MLSIITITKNDFQGLKVTLESTKKIREAYQEIEQLVIDGSDDDMALENSVLCRDHLKVNYFKREPKGISDAFNYGISQSKYDWFWFLNGGDQLHPRLDLNFFSGFLEHVSADILIFQLELMQKGTVVRFPSMQKCFPPVSPWIPHPATIIRKEIFSRHGGFDEKYKIAMDYELWLRVYGTDVVINMVSIPITLFDEKGMSNTQIGLVNLEGKHALKKNSVKLFRLWLAMGKNMTKQYRFFKRMINGN